MRRRLRPSRRRLMPVTLLSDLYLPFYMYGTNQETVMTLPATPSTTSWFLTAPSVIYPRQGVAANIYTVTPEVASRWLEYNCHNRRVRQARVDSIATDILTGAWVLDGNPIRFGVMHGTVFLADGQHRLQAIVAADKSVASVVVTGLKAEAQDVIDTGAKRTFSDRLTLAGIPNSRHTASMLRKIWQYQTGVLTSGTAQPTHTQLWKILQANPDVQRDVRRGMTVNANIRGPIGVYAMASYMFRNVDEEDAKYFFDHLRSGGSLPAGHPILQLRKRMMDNALSKTKLTDVEIAAMTVKAWNGFRTGDHKPTVLRWTRGGTRAQEFPVPR